MAHLAATYSSFDTFLNGADAFWKVDFDALNSSGVNATAVLAMNTEEDGTSYLNVAISATGATANQTHVQHIHGLFDADGNPIDSVTPTIANDADRDGLVEVLEGVGQYGDVLLPLTFGGAMPVADALGTISFIANYDLGDDSNFFSPVTDTDYTAEDIMPLILRELVIHGVEIPDGIGDGTGGEVDGGVNGYIPILPAAAGTIETATLEEARAILTGQRATASDDVTLTENADTYDGGIGDDNIKALGGDDTVQGGGDNDTIDGGTGADVLEGGNGNDVMSAGAGDTNVVNAADAGASGGLTLAQYDSGIAGGAGDDIIYGGAGDEILTGDDESRTAEVTGSTFASAADGMDTIYGGAGNDEIHTGSWADSDQGFDNTQTGVMADVAYGGSGGDIIRGAGGADLLVGESGADNIGGGGGDDEIFGDGGYSVDPEVFTGQLYRLYQASFDRDPDIAGFENWAARLGSGAQTLDSIADAFEGSREFANTYGSASNADFVNALYQNVLDRGADTAGFNYWTDTLDNGASRADVLTGFSESREFRNASSDELFSYVKDMGTQDVLAGNGGANTLSGGYFSDSFVFSTDAGSSHTVTDLEIWDTMDFTAFGYDSSADATANMMQSGSDVVFADQNVTVTLLDTQLGTLTDDMFLI
jgi:Ca2+-binding RTX toxin-like protein